MRTALWQQQLLLLLLLLLQAGWVSAGNQCYLEGSDCALCWVTDSSNRRTVQPCPPSVQARFVLPLPELMYEAHDYPVAFWLSLNSSELDLVRIPDMTGEGEWDVTYGEVHACFSAGGACTPFASGINAVNPHNHTMSGRLSPNGTFVFHTEIGGMLPAGMFMVVGHFQFAVLDDGVADPIGGCNGRDCLKIYSVGIGIARTIRPREESPLSKCYMKLPASEDCDLCWKTDSAGVTSSTECPASFRLKFESPPPTLMTGGVLHDIRYSVEMGPDMASQLYRGTDLQLADSSAPGQDALGLVDIQHANVHSCNSKAKYCTPFFAETPGLATHTPDLEGDLGPDGRAEFMSPLSLRAGIYMVISHIRYQVLDPDVSNPIGGCDGQDCLTTYDNAVGKRVAVLPSSALVHINHCESPSCVSCWASAPFGTAPSTECPAGVTVQFDPAPPGSMMAGQPSSLQTMISIQPELNSFMLHPLNENDGGVLDKCRSYVVVCDNVEGHCIPRADSALIVNSAATDVFESRTQVQFMADLELPEGDYFVIVLFQLYGTSSDTLNGFAGSCADLQCADDFNIVLSAPLTVKGSAASGYGTWAIVGTVAAAVAVVLLAGLLGYWLLRRRGQSEESDEVPGLGLDTYGSVVVNVASSTSGRTGFHGKTPKDFCKEDKDNKVACKTLILSKSNPEFHELPEQVVDLHEGIEDEYKHRPMRFLRASYISGGNPLLCYEEMFSFPDSFIDVAYARTSQDMWNKTAMVSWRWARAKPEVMDPGFSPLSPAQLVELRSCLATHPNIEYVWVDWSCVPQYHTSPMFEVARSKLFYARAKQMYVLPTFAPLPEGQMRVILAGIIRGLVTLWQEERLEETAQVPASSKRKPSADGVSPSRKTSRKEYAVLACSALKSMRSRGEFAEYGYFNRVWTLAERVARYGRSESLQNWMTLEVWLGVTFNALLMASVPDPECGQRELRRSRQSCDLGSWCSVPGLKYFWGGLFEREKSRQAIQSLKLVRQRGSNLAVSGNVSVTLQIADLMIDAVEIWKEPFRTEALDTNWLRNYLLNDAGNLYHAWNQEDAVFAIYTFFCWHLRHDFVTAHNDLCLLAGIDEEESSLWTCVNSLKRAAAFSRSGSTASTDVLAGLRHLNSNLSQCSEVSLGRLGTADATDFMAVVLDEIEDPVERNKASRSNVVAPVADFLQRLASGRSARSHTDPIIDSNVTDPES